jgi:hypothetical protein
MASLQTSARYDHMHSSCFDSGRLLCYKAGLGTPQ